MDGTCVHRGCGSGSARVGKIVDGGFATMQRELPNMIAASRASRAKAIGPDDREDQLASNGGRTAFRDRAADGVCVVFRGDQNDSVCWETCDDVSYGQAGNARQWRQTA